MLIRLHAGTGLKQLSGGVVVQHEEARIMRRWSVTRRRQQAPPGGEEAGIPPFDEYGITEAEQAASQLEH